MSDLLAALLLGIIEGITEFLPISSTGHLLIAEHWLGARSDLFNISIQAGAILAVVLIYRERLWQLTTGWRERNKRDYILKLVLAFGVTAIFGLLVKKLGVELPETLAPIAWALLIGGFVILGVEAIDARRPDLPDDDPDAIGWGTALLVGLAQVVAGVFPGTSRSAAAIFAALLFGRSSRLAATEFAFLVGIPTMFAATGYELLSTLRSDGSVGEDWGALAVAFVASAFTAFVAVKWLLGYIQTHRFTVFAWYRIAFGSALLAWLYFGAAAPSHEASAAAMPTTVGIMQTMPERTAQAGTPQARAGQAHTAAAIAAPAADSLPTDPASLALLREFRLRNLCTQAMYVRADLADPKTLTYFDALTNPKVQPQVRAEIMSQWQKGLDWLDRADRDCSGLGARLFDGSSYDVARRAAEHGDSQAAQCFVAATFPMPPALHERPEVLTQFRLDAARIIELGIARGDWNMVSAALMAYAPRRTFPEPAFEAPFYAPGLRLTATIGGPAGDVETAYRMARLMELGATGTELATSYGDTIAELAHSLSAKKRSAGDAWARETFQRTFKRRPLREEDTTFCENDV